MYNGVVPVILRNGRALEPYDRIINIVANEINMSESNKQMIPGKANDGPPRDGCAPVVRSASVFMHNISSCKRCTSRVSTIIFFSFLFPEPTRCCWDCCCLFHLDGVRQLPHVLKKPASLSLRRVHGHSQRVTKDNPEGANPIPRV